MTSDKPKTHFLNPTEKMAQKKEMWTKSHIFFFNFKNARIMSIPEPSYWFHKEAGYYFVFLTN